MDSSWRQGMLQYQHDQNPNNVRCPSYTIVPQSIAYTHHTADPGGRQLPAHIIRRSVCYNFDVYWLANEIPNREPNIQLIRGFNSLPVGQATHFNAALAYSNAHDPRLPIPNTERTFSVQPNVRVAVPMYFASADIQAPVRNAEPMTRASEGNLRTSPGPGEPHNRVANSSNMVERRAQVSRMKDGYSWHPYDPQAAKFKSNPKASMISSSVEPSHDTVTVKTEVPSFEETALACKAPRSEKFSQLISFFSPQGALKLFPVIDCQFQNCSARLTGLDAFAKHIFGPTSEGGHGLRQPYYKPPASCPWTGCEMTRSPGRLASHILTHAKVRYICVLCERLKTTIKCKAANHVKEEHWDEITMGVWNLEEAERFWKEVHFRDEGCEYAEKRV